MSKKNERLFAEVEEAIDALFSDTSVSQEECRQNLEALIANLQNKIDSLDMT